MVAIVLLTLTPIKTAASLSSDTAIIALPVLDRLINVVNPIMITIHAIMVTTVSPDMEISPSASLIGSKLKTDVKDLMFAPNIRSARFCSK